MLDVACALPVLQRPANDSRPTLVERELPWVCLPTPESKQGRVGCPIKVAAHGAAAHPARVVSLNHQTD